MFCQNCGKQVVDQAVACPACGVPPRQEKKFCATCGAATEPNQAMCTKCGTSLVAASGSDKNKLVAGLLGIFLGGLGIHKFYLGYQKEGLVMLLVAIIGGAVTCGAVYGVMGIIGLIEGIIYLTKTDQQFALEYVTNKKGWF